MVVFYKQYPHSDSAGQAWTCALHKAALTRSEFDVGKITTGATGTLLMAQANGMNSLRPLKNHYLEFT
jgi:hypothetical protein